MDFEDSNLFGADIENYHFIDCIFTNANLQELNKTNFNLINIKFETCIFKNCRFDNSNLVGCIFIDCDLRHLDFSNVKGITRNSFYNCNLEGILLNPRDEGNRPRRSSRKKNKPIRFSPY